LTMLAHPPMPKPTTSTHTTMNRFTRNIPVQLGRKKGGFSAAFLFDGSHRKQKGTRQKHRTRFTQNIAVPAQCEVMGTNMHLAFLSTLVFFSGVVIRTTV
jgi:hypothetical protein